MLQLGRGFFKDGPPPEVLRAWALKAPRPGRDHFGRPLKPRPVWSGAPAAAAHVPVLCAGRRVLAADLAPSLRESPEVRALVERLVKRDVLWAEF